jgi:hypothetical protein
MRKNFKKDIFTKNLQNLSATFTPGTGSGSIQQLILMRIRVSNLGFVEPGTSPVHQIHIYFLRPVPS